MHQDPWEPADGSFPSERKPHSDANGADPPADGEITRVPKSLLNWQVVEIDGEATLIEETEIEATEIEEVNRTSIRVASPTAAQDVTGSPSVARPFSATSGASAVAPFVAIDEHYDEIVVGGIQLRRVVVMPGAAASFEVNVANHGRWSALFEITLEGWIDESWTPDLPMRVQLEPGVRQTVTLTIMPPRQASCHAGDHALAVVVRAARYPGHVTRMAATLVIERYAALRLGAPQPRELPLSWFVPAATLRLPITNQSNYAATIHLQGMDRQRQCDFTFYTGGNNPGGNNLDDGILGAAQITLAPGQTVAVPVEIRARQRPIIGMMPRITSFRLVARMDTEPPLRRAVDGQLASSALIGPWQMASAAVLGLVAIFGIGLAGLALLVALRSADPAMPAALVAAAPADTAPVVALVIQMDEPMPTRVPVVAANGAPENAAPAQALSQEPSVVANEPFGIPVVRADQVTAPGEPTPIDQTPLRPLVVTTPGPEPEQRAVPAPAQVNNANLTYGQMFQQVALQYDLDWRMLAAQAYLESGFDSLALSGDGDMGLMQIRPGTWHEWAPTVDASDPFDSYSNVLVGAVYLDYLRKQLSERGQARQEWMLVAYNWGPDKVFAHLRAGGTWESLDPARRQYAEDVLRIAASIPPS